MELWKDMAMSAKIPKRVGEFLKRLLTSKTRAATKRDRTADNPESELAVQKKRKADLVNVADSKNSSKKKFPLTDRK